MTLPQAVLLGFVQGLTEFLPVSSSGHLVIAQNLLGISQNPIPFDVLVHAGTLFSVIVFFQKRLRKISLKLIKLTLTATAPVVIIGLISQHILDKLFSSLIITAAGLLITGILLASTKFLTPVSSKKNLTTRNAILIGFFQALAIIPGISRSASTVTSALHLGITKHDAFFFSFLLSIPAILGAQILQLTNQISPNQLFNTANILGFTVAALTGLLALRLLRFVIDKAKLHLFAYYCISLGIILLLANSYY